MEVTDSVHKQMNIFAIAAAAIVTVLALASPAQAKIVYTEVNISLDVNSSHNIDLNGDGVTDFTISTFFNRSSCHLNEGVSETPASGNGVVGAPPAALKAGELIGPSQTFYQGEGGMAHKVCGDGADHHCVCDPPGGTWFDVNSRYLGLMFQVNGETYYGWARLEDGLYTATLVSFAYQTIPGKPIKAGQR
jgi:hypothetical protein